MPRCHTNAAGSDRDCPARIVPPLRLVDAGVTEHQLDRAVAFEEVRDRHGGNVRTVAREVVGWGRGIRGSIRTGSRS